MHGRCVLFPSAVLKRFGLHDDLTLPHYSADTDYSRHIAEGGVSMLVVPAARVSLDTTTTGLGAAPKHRERSPLAGATKRYWRQLTDRKSGELLHTTWTLSRRYVPWYGVLPTMAFGLGVTTVRFWQREARRAKAAADEGKGA